MSVLILNSEQCWLAVQKRDKNQDGKFYYGVLTTGVYCRPACPSRLPKLENVRFYATPADAAADGLRPCKRCKPLEKAAEDTDAGRFRAICEYMEDNVDVPLVLADLARRANLTSFHFQRKFKTIVGVSPKEYLDHCRMRKFKSILRENKPDGVTGAIYEAGFGASSRVYEKSGTRLGMTPMEYRAGGEGVDVAYAASETPLGLMMVGATDRGLCFVQFGDKAEALEESLRSEYPKARIAPMPAPEPPEFRAWIEALNAYLAGQAEPSHLPVHVRATAFQMKVWKYLQSIPDGEVASYGEVAEGIGSPKATRAVARACASNRVAIAIPCHRVIRGTGELGGYRWGMERKRTLIDIERQRKAQGSK